jgi:hypothetical protein
MAEIKANTKTIRQENAETMNCYREFGVISVQLMFADADSAADFLGVVFGYEKYYRIAPRAAGVLDYRFIDERPILYFADYHGHFHVYPAEYDSHRSQAKMMVYMMPVSLRFYSPDGRPDWCYTGQCSISPASLNR